MATFVEDIRNFLLLKSHYLYRLENKTIKEMIKPYEEAKKTIVDRINRLSEELEQQAEIRYSNYTVLKLNYMLAEINEVLRIAAIDSERVLQQIREEVARVEYEQLSKILQDKYSKINIDVLGVPYRQIDYILQNPMLGESIGDKLLWANSSALRYMQREIYQSIILGETIQQATKRLLGTGKKLSGLSGNLLLNRARTIARTEILYVSNEVNRAIYRQNMDVIKGVQFVSTLDSRTCIYCGKLSGEIFLYENGIDKSPPVPRHPNCFVDHQIPIYTSEGWKPIGKVEKDDLVLTHKGRFKKVTNVIRSKEIDPKVVTFTVSYPKIAANKKFATTKRKLTVTEDHPILVNGIWISAKNIKVGDKIKYLATKCKTCGKIIPYDKKFCSNICISKDITKNQWSSEEHRALISKKIKKSMLDQYAMGLRDGNKSTEKAREKVRDMVKKGQHWFRNGNPYSIGDKNAAKRPEVRKFLSERMKGDNNPLRKYPHLKAVISQRNIERYIKNPESHINRILAKKGHETDIERIFRIEMEKRKLIFEKQYKIDRYYVDFAFPESKIVIECEGSYWHDNKVSRIKDKVRELKIRKLGWTVLRYRDEKIYKNIEDCVDEVCRILNNHNDNYVFMDLEICEVKHWKVKKIAGKKRCTVSTVLYNLSVEDDESYVAHGIVSHNCRCVYVPLTYSWEELEKMTGVKITSKSKKDYFSGAEDREMPNYSQWLKQQPTEVQKEILGKKRYKAWKDNNYELTEMATQTQDYDISAFEAKVSEIKTFEITD